MSSRKTTHVQRGFPMGRWKPKLPYHKATKQWRKVYRGKTYYLGVAKSKSDRESHERALAKWEGIKADVDGQPEPEKPNQRDYDYAIGRWEKMAQWYQQAGDQEGAARCAREIEALKRRLNAKELPPLDRWERDPLKHVSEAGLAVWQDRFQQLDNPLPEDRTVGGQVQAWLEGLQSQVTIGVLTPDRFESYRCCVNNFRDWIGAKHAVESIDEVAIEGFYTHLVEEVARRKRDRSNKDGCSPAYAGDQLTTAKQFIFWCFERRLLALPHNIKSTKHRFVGKKSSRPKRVYFENEELLLLLDNATERLKLYLLLMMNCGYTQSDLSDLRHDEVDWKAGRIIRRRSKTDDHHEDTDVPVVNYVLWPETHKLLKKHRSDVKEHGTVFVTERGMPLVQKSLKDGKLSKTDNIQSMYRRLRVKLKLTGNRQKPLKAIRKTSADKIGTNRKYMMLKDHFLGHSPRTVAERHYSDSVPQDLFDEAVQWLAQDYGLAKPRKRLESE